MIHIFYHILKVFLIGESILVMKILFIKFLGMFLFWHKHGHRDEYYRREHFSFWAQCFSVIFQCSILVIKQPYICLAKIQLRRISVWYLALTSLFNVFPHKISHWVGKLHKFCLILFLLSSSECYTDWDKITLKRKL